MQHLIGDARLAMRALRSAPGFSAAAILTLAVALGATTAILSVFDRLVLNPVTMPDPGSLMAIWFNNPQRNVQAFGISIPRYDELAAQTRSFSSIGLAGGDTFTLTGNGDPLQLNGLRVSASFLPTLGVLPARGRTFLTSEDVPNGPAVCIVSHELWQTAFGAREDLVGRTIELDGRPTQVVGIMQPAFTAPFGQVQVFTPRAAEVSYLTPQQVQGGATFFQPIARLKPGVSLAQATSELAAFSTGYGERHSGLLDAKNITYPRRFVEALVSGFAPSMYTLLGAVACVLLIACANTASLFLNRLLGRRKDIAVRMALGASRAAVVRPLLVESVLYSAIAATVGAVIATGSLDALSAVVSSQLPPNTRLALNWRVLGLTALVSLVAAAVTGLVPALQAARADLLEHLSDSARGSSSGQGGRLRRALVVSEVAVSVVLLVGAALLLVSFVRLQRSTLGFETKGIATAAVGLAPARYSTPAQQMAFYEGVVERLKSDPTITGAAASMTVPLTGSSRTPYAVAGRAVPPMGERPITNFNLVTDDFFKIFAVPVVEGRALSTDDRASSLPVCLVNETLAKRLFDGRSALGESLLIGRDASVALRIVGVIRDMKSAGANAPVPDELYMPLRQRPNPSLNIVVRTAGDASQLQAIIRRAVASVDGTQAISLFTTMDATAAQALGTQRLVATLVSLFAAVALGLALIGLCSVIAYGVTQRTPELGIRMALGASSREVVALVMREGLRLVAVGIIVGLSGAAAASRLIRQLLFGVEPLSGLVYASVAAAFVVVAALACLAPSLRASRIDPLAAVRGE